jgi:hypothetical protein
MHSLKNSVISISLAFSGMSVNAQTAMEVKNPSSLESSNIRTMIEAQTRLNRLEVNSEKSARVEYRSYGVEGTYRADSADLGLGVDQLQRERKDFRAGSEFSRDTQVYTPTFTWFFNDNFYTTVKHSEYRTDVERRDFMGEDYRLDGRRSSISATFIDGSNIWRTSAYTELRSEHEYTLGEYAFTDRDYIPAQAKFEWLAAWTPRLSSSLITTYSHYNHDVYKDQYDSDVPSTPTLPQVFDYLLTLGAEVKYSLLNNLDLSAGILRKAALDVNSYTGDEYVRAATLSAGVEYEPIQSLSLGAATTQSAGEKTHEVNGQSYKYANNLESYRASVGYVF